jgi:PQQ enzyme repeat
MRSLLSVGLRAAMPIILVGVLTLTWMTAAQESAAPSNPAAMFGRIASVLQSPRCLNCHTVTDFPRGGAEWNGAAYNPETDTLYTGMVDWCWYYFERPNPKDPKHPIGSPIWNFSAPVKGQITAIDGESGDILWQYQTPGPVTAGLVPTRSGLLFGGDVRGNLFAGLHGIEWVLLRDHSGGNACG